MEKGKIQGRLWLLVTAFVIVLGASLLTGRYPVSPGSLWTAVTGGPVTQVQAAVLLRIRVPRVLTAALVGAALSVAGAAYQGVFRNPMASPDLLGASTGAGFGAALGILLYFSYGGVVASAFFFGLAAVALAWLFGRLGRLEPVLSMVLAGLVIGALFSAGTSLIKLVADTDRQLPAITYWLMGSLSSVQARDLRFAAAPILFGCGLLFTLRWRMNLLTLSEEESRSMGVHPGRLRGLVILAATLLTAASVAVSGAVGWVGLIIPHLCRIGFGSDYRRLLPAAALLGATFLMAMDTLARTLLTSEIPLGILTALFGAPVFLFLLLGGGGSHRR